MSADFGLVMPFVVHPDTPDEGYVLGWEASRIDRFLQGAADLGSVTYKAYLHTANVPQLDLVAMRHGFTLTAEPWADAPDEWSWCEFTNTPSDTEEQPGPRTEER